MVTIPLRTIRDLAEHGYGLWAFCENVGCARHRRGGGAELDLNALIATGEGDATLDELRPKLRCEICGERGAAVRIVSSGRPRR